LNDGKLATRQEIQDAINVQKSYASELIADMKKQGVIDSEGRGPATKYYRSDLV
jgi:Mn-dependent DtxR family transcriptional regulator